MKRNQLIIAGASIAGLLLFLYLNRKKKTGRQAVFLPDDALPVTPPAGLDLDKRLSKGSRGAEVRYLQQLMIQEKFMSIGQDDGIFGPITEGTLIAARSVPAITLRAYIAGM